ncbi:MAG: SidE phosphodiesterase domain-containing protein [Coxiellaceae bacterium]|nr:SidE phosphodiesterase domain-containing protein [Coxiellaceae bacterium]
MYSALETAVYKIGDVDVVDAILANSPKEDVSALISYALKAEQYDVATSLYNFHQHRLVGSEVESLLQGPSQKNRAHRDIEYILHCVLGLAFTAVPSDHGRYDAVGEGDNNATLAIGKTNHLMATCSNGVTYSVSLALKYANLYHFILDPLKYRDVLLALQANVCERLEEAGEAKTDELLMSDMGSMIGNSDDPLLVTQIEIDAINKYTSEYFALMNNLLRGHPLGESNITGLEVILCQALLVVSAANKLVDPSQRDSSVVRYEGAVPLSIELAMAKGVPVRRGGMNSYSANVKGAEAFRHHQSKIVLHGTLFASISQHSAVPTEVEHLLPPLHLQVDESQEVDGQMIYTAHAVHGVLVDNADEYTVDMALYQVATIVKNAYEDKPDPLFGVNRHNHALAHHIRVVSYVDAVMLYFSHHAVDPKFKQYCNTRVPAEINIIKVLLAVSKVGRESEIGFFDNPELYQDYQEVSVAYLMVFLSEIYNFDDDQCDFYAQILCYMGDPHFADKATGTGQQQQEKIWINHIITFAHKLDLARCYDSHSYQRSLHLYGDVCDSLDDLPVVELSDAQSQDLRRIKKQARLALQFTGDRVMFADLGMPKLDYEEHEFRLCNEEVAHCKEKCKQAELMVRECEVEISKNDAICALMMTLRDSDALHQLVLLPKEQLMQLLAQQTFWDALYQMGEPAAFFKALSNIVCKQPHPEEDVEQLFVYKAIERQECKCILYIISQVGLENLLLQQVWPIAVFQGLLFIAVRNGYIEMYDDLLAYPIDMRGADSDGDSVLHIAIKNSQHEMLERLLQNDWIDVNQADALYLSPLMLAFCVDQWAMAAQLLRHPAINVDYQDSDGNTALALIVGEEACSDFSEDIIKHPTFKPNTQSFEGSTVLHEAIELRNFKLANQLLDRDDTDVSLLQYDGTSVLMLAVTRGQTEMVKRILAKSDENINAQSQCGMTALTYAFSKCG